MKFLQGLILVLFILLTAITVKIHPDIHQPVLIEDQDFVLTRISDTITTTPQITVAPDVNQTNQQEIVVQPQETKIIEQPVQNYENTQTRYVDTSIPQNKNVNVNIPVTQNQKKEVNVVVPKTQTPQTTTNIPKDEQSQLDLLNRLLNTPVEQIEINVEEKNNKPVVNVKINDQPKPQEKKVEVTQPKSSSNPYMTEEEEIIAWNKWRANVTNQIMKDSNVGSAFMGTVFHFTFVVDKFGNVSNIRVESNPAAFMDLARNGLKPAIANLQNKPILKFPQGTKRTTVIVDDSFIISTQNNFATPNLYSDYERVKR